MPSVTQLKYILAVDKEKHFGKAAESCGVTQPSLSMQIQKLEEELDVIVFDRSKKPILTTDTGKALLNQARIILKEFKKIDSIADSYNDVPSGDFNLAIIPTVSTYLIPYFLKEFALKFPEVQLKISELKTEDIISSLHRDEIDAAVLVTPLGDDQLIERHLYFENFSAFVSKDHALAKKKRLQEKDLEKEGLWLLGEGHCFRDQVLKVCSYNKRVKPFQNVDFESGNLETLKSLVIRNSGFTLLPELATLDLSESKRQKYIRDFQKPIPTREVSLVYGRSFLKEKIIDSLEEVIVKNLPKSIKSLKRKDVEVIEIY